MNEEEIPFADNGHMEFLETIKTPVWGSDAHPLGVLGIGRNVSGRKSLEAELRRMNRLYNLLG